MLGGLHHRQPSVHRRFSRDTRVLSDVLLNTWPTEAFPTRPGHFGSISSGLPWSSSRPLLVRSLQTKMAKVLPWGIYTIGSFQRLCHRATPWCGASLTISHRYLAGAREMSVLWIARRLQEWLQLHVPPRYRSGVAVAKQRWMWSVGFRFRPDARPARATRACWACTHLWLWLQKRAMSGKSMKTN
jgi:hypothetical protein